MKATLAWLGLIFGTLTVLVLIKHGLDYGVGAPLSVVVEFYQRSLHLLTGWAEPWIGAQLRALGAWIGWQLHLYPHWRDVLVPLGILFGAMARQSARVGVFDRRTIYFVIVGQAMGLLTSVAVGVLPLDDVGPTAPLIGTLPLFGLGLYFLLVAFFYYASYGFRPLRPVGEEAAVGVALSVLGLGWWMAFEDIHAEARAGLVLLALVVAFMGVGFIVSAAADFWSTGLEKTETDARKRFKLTDYWNFRLGAGILGVFAGAAAFVVMNAGLELVFR